MGAGSGVGGEQKLCKPHTERGRGPPDALTDAQSVCLHASACSLFVRQVFSYICLSTLNAFPFVLRIDKRCHPHFSVRLFKTLFTILVYSAKCLGERAIQTPAGKKLHLKAFTAPGLSSLSFCGFTGSKESCLCYSQKVFCSYDYDL